MHSTCDTETDSSIETDEELQKAFAEGTLNKRHSKDKCTCDLISLNNRIDELKAKKVEWLERMDVTLAGDELEDNDNDNTPVNHENDFQREIHFIHQAQKSAIIGLKKLTDLGVKVTRPQDYFAEMLKDDEQMRKVRQNMVKKQKRIETAEKAKKLRDIKKYGKKVQNEILANRLKDKQKTIQAVKDYYKGGDKPSFLKREDDEFGLKVDRGNESKKGQSKSKRRQNKDIRYGMGGRKKYLKTNTSESSADMRSFRRNGVSMSKSSKTKKNSNKKRLGKSRRHKIQHKKK